MPHAKGTFDIRFEPGPVSGIGARAGLGRMSINKQYFGNLTGHSGGEMLSIAEPSSGAMAYVALEKVEGTLDGRAGTFILMQTGQALKGSSESSMTVSVLPKSGTGQLASLAGEMTFINSEGGSHAYAFSYSL